MMEAVNEPEGAMTMDAAEMAIREMFQSMGTMGGNDREPSQVQGILDQLKDGTLTSDGAVAAAEAILDRKIKGAYH
jgi:hypothetical protein